MSKFIAACLLGVSLLAFLSVGCGIVSNDTSGQKHTGYVTVRAITDGYAAFEFIRPNSEIFEMKFEGYVNSPKLNIGDTLTDLVYTDGKNSSVFVKAVLDKEAPVSEKIEQECSQQQPYGWVICSSSGPCQSNAPPQCQTAKRLKKK